MKTQIAEILAKYNVKKSAEIMAEIEALLKTKKDKVSRETIERERINPETQEPEIMCRDFEAWMPRALGVFDKDGKYEGYSKCAVKAFNHYKKLKQENSEKALALALEGKFDEAKALKEALADKASVWCKNEKWENYLPKTK